MEQIHKDNRSSEHIADGVQACLVSLKASAERVFRPSFTIEAHFGPIGTEKYRKIPPMQQVRALLTSSWTTCNKKWI
jgi:hypothetical protein